MKKNVMHGYHLVIKAFEPHSDFGKYGFAAIEKSTSFEFDKTTISSIIIGSEDVTSITKGAGAIVINAATPIESFFIIKFSPAQSITSFRRPNSRIILRLFSRPNRILRLIGRIIPLFPGLDG